jgi:hypothetical protein
MELEMSSPCPQLLATVQSSKLLLALAITVILGIEPRRDPWRNLTTTNRSPSAGSQSHPLTLSLTLATLLYPELNMCIPTPCSSKISLAPSLMLPSHLRLGLPSCRYILGCLIRIFYVIYIVYMNATFLSHRPSCDEPKKIW